VAFGDRAPERAFPENQGYPFVRRFFVAGTGWLRLGNAKTWCLLGTKAENVARKVRSPGFRRKSQNSSTRKCRPFLKASHEKCAENVGKVVKDFYVRKKEARRCLDAETSQPSSLVPLFHKFQSPTGSFRLQQCLLLVVEKKIQTTTTLYHTILVRSIAKKRKFLACHRWC